VRWLNANIAKLCQSPCPFGLIAQGLGGSKSLTWQEGRDSIPSWTLQAYWSHVDLKRRQALGYAVRRIAKDVLRPFLTR